MIRRTTIVTGVVLDERIEFSLGELCQSCGVSAETIIEMVDEGMLEPLGASPDSWRFRGLELRRVQSALRLNRDLRVNYAGAALALELLDELDELRRQLRYLRDQAEPPERGSR
jgi:chaperone modulatory protein CbpM